MQSIPITFQIMCVLGVLMVTLSVMVSIRRVRLGLEHGNMAKFPYQDGGDEKLRRRVRAFGNFSENAPTSIVALGLLEMSGASAMLVGSLGGAFIVGRISHATGMLINPHFPLPRALGMFATYGVLLAPAIFLFFQFL